MPKNLKCYPHVIYAVQHKIAPSSIPQNAVSVVECLTAGGFESYLVGGGVRDLFLGKHPKDFDIVTNALPRDIKTLFGSRCRLIGRRFTLAHVRVNRQVFEVSTFRAMYKQDQICHEGIVKRDNCYGTMDEDAYRRDFTVNGLYYDLQSNVILDFTGGVEDLEHLILRIIGDPETRYREDPVRMLRAIRFIAKIGLSPASGTKKAILKLRHLLQNISSARLYEETIKLFQCGFAAKTFPLLNYYGLFEQLFPIAFPYLKQDSYRSLVRKFCENTDQRTRVHKPVMPAFLFAITLWPLFIEGVKERRDEGMSPCQAIECATKELLEKQMQSTMLPLRVREMVRDMWGLAYRLEKRDARYVYKYLTQPRFRAAYDVLWLYSYVCPDVVPLVQWWTTFQSADETQQQKMVECLKLKKACPAYHYSIF